MQETRYTEIGEGPDFNPIERRLIETFEGGNPQDVYSKMNQRLFELEAEGHTLVQQKTITFAERRRLERISKIEKKKARMRKNGIMRQTPTGRLVPI